MTHFFSYVKEAETEREYVVYESGKPGEERMRWLAAQHDIVDWLKKHPEYASSSTILRYLHDFLEYLSVDGGSPLRGCLSFDEMLGRLEEMKLRKQKVVGQYLFGFCNAMKVKRRSKVTYYNKIRSLFRASVHNMYFLDGERLPWIDDISPFNSEFEATKADFIRVLSCIDEPRWRSAFLCKFQMMVGEIEFIQFSNEGWPLIEEQIRSGMSLNGRHGCAVFVMPPRPKIRNKGSLPYPTSIEADGVAELRKYLEMDRGTPRPGEAIWLTQQNNPLSLRSMRLAWKNYLRKSGIIKPYAPTCPTCGGRLRMWKPLMEDGGRPHLWRCRGCGGSWRRGELVGEPSHRELSRIRYNFGLHEMSRDITSSELEIAYYRTGVPQWLTHVRMGNTRKVDSNQYQKITQKNLVFAEEMFNKISPWLNVLSEDPERVPRAEMESKIRGMEEAQRAAQREVLARLEFLERRMLKK